MKYTIDNNTIQFEQGNNQISVSVKELEHILQKTKIKDEPSREKLCENTGNLIYSIFDVDHHIVCPPDDFEEYYVSCAYGTVNPFSLGLWGKHGDKWYRINEYYYSAREKGFQLTDQEYYNAPSFGVAPAVACMHPFLSTIISVEVPANPTFVFLPTFSTNNLFSGKYDVEL